MKKAEKNKQKRNHGSVIVKNDLKKLIVLVAVVTAIFLIFYGVTLLVSPKQPPEEFDVLEETIQYDEILVGQILNRVEKNYYVLVKNSDNFYNDLYLSYLDLFVKKNNSNKYYLIDLSQSFNQGYKADITSVNSNDVNNFKFSDTTLIKVKDNKIDEVYTTKEAIETALEKMI